MCLKLNQNRIQNNDLTEIEVKVNLSQDRLLKLLQTKHRFPLHQQIQILSSLKTFHKTELSIVTPKHYNLLKKMKEVKKLLTRITKKMSMRKNMMSTWKIQTQKKIIYMISPLQKIKNLTVSHFISF